MHGGAHIRFFVAVHLDLSRRGKRRRELREAAQSLYASYARL